MTYIIIDSNYFFLIMCKSLLMSFLFLFVSFIANGQQTITVAQDGSGDYNSVQAAVDAVEEGTEATIVVKAGVYDERVNIGSRQKASTKRINMIGDGIDKTIITSPLGLKSTPKAKDIYQSAALAVYADDFYAEGITFRNTAGKEGGQALAIFVSGDRQTFSQCAFRGYQDTHRSKKGTRSYYKECVVEGATDYIYSGGTAWFESCTLHCLAGGYITAPEDINVFMDGADGTRIYLGFVFNRCTVTAPAGTSNNSVYLGRCWGAEKCGSLFMNCNLGALIHPAGWSEMGGNNGEKSFFAEYRNVDETGQLADTSKRVSWGHQLSDADYAKLSSWEQVDEVFRHCTNNEVEYHPEQVIASHKGSSDYTALESKLLAFPTARGFGKYASGGRGGKVVEVTTLEDSGEGSLRWALTEAGTENATIVFRVSGIITIGEDPKSNKKPKERTIRAKLKNVTIAGQTAPGEGILIRGGKINLGGSENVIIRNIRCRVGLNESDGFIAGAGLGIENANNIIIDHCCFGWSGEENMTMYDNHFTTVQWCIVHEGLYDAGHAKGNRSYANQWGGSPATYHHNLMAHNFNRSARLNGASNSAGDRNVFMEFFNNVNYNWGKKNSCYGGENEAGSQSSHECNFVGNYYKPGPSTPDDSYFIEMSAARKGKTLNGPSVWYFNGNVMEGNESASNNNWNAIHNNTGFPIEQMKSEQTVYPSKFYPKQYNYDDYITPTESAEDAYNHVLAHAGTMNRDVIERRIVSEVANKTAQYKGTTLYKAGFIDSPADAEGWPVYQIGVPVIDNDHDGMDDDWESAHGLNPADPEDRNTIFSQEGYTALEVYLNSLMGEYITIAAGISLPSKESSIRDIALFTPGGLLVKQFSSQKLSVGGFRANIRASQDIPSGLYIARKTYDDNRSETTKFIKY